MLVYTVCVKGGSVREAILRDRKLEDHGLAVRKGRKVGRKPGWAKLHSTDRIPGAINLEWDGDAGVLVARVISRGRQRPSAIVGRFVEYLADRHHRRILTITVVPR